MDLRAEFPRPPQIILADDDWLTRDLLQTYLETAGCQVHVCKDGAQAWEAIESLSADLALLDIQMPHLDGLSLCHRIKTDPRTRLMPVLIVTALDAQDEKLNAIESGADDFITKPFNAEILLTRVRSLLRLKHLHDELENRNRLLHQVLHRYVDREVADTILTDPERYLKLGGETRRVTVLFADLRGFTAFTAAHPAAEVVESVNEVFQALTQVVYDYGGTFDKYLGDAVLAFFGAPLTRPDDALRALRSALEMQRRFDALRAADESGRLQSLEGLGIGVHSGDAIVGNIGSDRVMDYTVIGVAANITRTLQEAARPGEILISESTLQLAPQARTSLLTTRHFPGQQQPLGVYALLGINHRSE